MVPQQRPHEVAGIETPEPREDRPAGIGDAAMTEAESKVLRRIATSPILLKGPDAYADVGERTGKEALLRLENLRLIHRPKGPKSGYAATDAGRNSLS